MRSIDQSTEDLDKCNKNGKFDSQGQLQEIVAGLLTLVPIYLKIRSIYFRKKTATALLDISNEGGNISVLKKFVISSSRAPWSPVVLSAMYLRP
jgi:hypothetical protein